MALLYAYNSLNRRNPRIFKERLRLNTVRDCELVERYRLDRRSMEELTSLLEEDLKKETLRSQSVDVDTQVMIGLRCLAKGSFFSEVADIHGVSRATVCHVLDSFINAVNKNLDNIRFPTDKLNSIKLGFYKSCGIPNVVGAVDGTMIPIQAPTENEGVYVCRKGFHAINVQAVVDSNMRFLDVVADWPGSQHDAFIFDNCALKTYLEQRDVGFLLGDSGYPLRGYLMTPLLNSTTEAEEIYNARHACGRQVVEKAFGVLKSRFRCLHKSGGTLIFKPSKCCKVVTACMRLHNLCIAKNVPLLEPVLQDISNEQHRELLCDSDRTGREKQSDIVQLFS